MTWYLVFRALCVCAFVAAIGSLLAAVGLVDEGRPRGVGISLLSAFIFAIIGSLLIGLGWSEANP